MICAIQLFPITIMFLSLMFSMLISKLLMKQAPSLWSPLLRLAGLNCFVSITDRHSEQLDDNKEARWGNSLDSFILIMLIVHPTVLNQCWSAIFDSSSWMLLSANKFISLIQKNPFLCLNWLLFFLFSQNSNTFCEHGIFRLQFPSQQFCSSVLLLFCIEWERSV